MEDHEAEALLMASQCDSYAEAVNIVALSTPQQPVIYLGAGVTPGVWLPQLIRSAVPMEIQRAKSKTTRLSSLMMFHLRSLTTFKATGMSNICRQATPEW